MSRVGGNQINASSFSAHFGEHPILQVLKKYHHEASTLREKAQVQVLGRPDRAGRRCLKTVVDNGILFKTEQAMCSRMKREIKRTLEERPKIRTRKTGPVGPDLDWSVIYSDVPVTMFHEPHEKYGSDYFGAGHPEEEGRMLFPYDEFRLKINVSGFRQHATRPGCVETHNMGPEEVRLWTKWAYRNGIHYSGERGYVRTSSKQAWKEDMSVNSFRQLKDLGFVAKHSRSELARITRAARRGKRDALIGAQPAERLFVTRYTLTSKQIRDAWFRLSPKPRFQEFKATLDTCITLFPRRCRSVVPPIVYKSLKRLYSRPEKIVSGRPWFKPELDLRYVLEVKLPPSRMGYLKERRFVRKGARVREHLDGTDHHNLSAALLLVGEGDPDWVTWTGVDRTENSISGPRKRVGYVNRTLDKADFDRSESSSDEDGPLSSWKWN